MYKITEPSQTFGIEIEVRGGGQMMCPPDEPTYRRAPRHGSSRDHFLRPRIDKHLANFNEKVAVLALNGFMLGFIVEDVGVIRTIDRSPVRRRL